MERSYWKKLIIKVILALVVLFAVILVCLALIKPKQGEAAKWFDTHIGINTTDVDFDDFTDKFGKTLILKSMPDVSFTIEDTEEDGPRLFMIKDGQKEKLFGRGWTIINAYFCDINGDGVPELCITRGVGSGIIDSRIHVMDLASGELYELSDRGVNDYVLTEKDGKLIAIKRPYLDMDTVLEEGPLLLKNGELIIGK